MDDPKSRCIWHADLDEATASAGNGARRSAVEKGSVKWFNDAKGFGFITRSGQPDVFVHHTSIVAEGFRSLNEGDSVEFELIPDLLT